MTTANKVLNDKKIAILATDGYEQSELMEPLDKLRGLGATVHVIAPEEGEIRGWKGRDWGDSVHVDATIKQTLGRADEYDALVLPGGVMNPDQLRMNGSAIEFVRTFFKAGKPVGAICHGPQILIDCDVLKGRQMTSYPSIKNDLKNAGAKWSDRDVIVDQGLVTSRTPADLPAFIGKVVEEVREGIHEGQKTA